MKQGYQLISVLIFCCLFQIKAYGGFFDNFFGGYRGGNSISFYENNTYEKNVYYLDTTPITQKLDKIADAIDRTGPAHKLDPLTIQMLEKDYKVKEAEIGINLHGEAHQFVKDHGYPALMLVIEDRILYKHTNTAVAVAFAKAMKNQSITSNDNQTDLDDSIVTKGMDYQRLFGFIDFVRRNPKATDKEIEDRAKFNEFSNNSYVKGKSLFGSDLNLTPEDEIKALKYLAAQINDPANGINFNGIKYKNFEQHPEVFLQSMIGFNKHIRGDLEKTGSVYSDLQKFCSSARQSKTLKEPPYIYSKKDVFREEVRPRLCESRCEGNKNQPDNLSAELTLAKLKNVAKELEDKYKSESYLKTQTGRISTFNHNMEEIYNVSQKNCQLYQCTKKTFDYVCSTKWKDPTENRQVAQAIVQKHLSRADAVRATGTGIEGQAPGGGVGN
ncbi:MAG: hypothetical protein AABY53_03320 [Bdellovibrionota bacterium]